MSIAAELMPTVSFDLLSYVRIVHGDETGAGKSPDSFPA